MVLRIVQIIWLFAACAFHLPPKCRPICRRPSVRPLLDSPIPVRCLWLSTPHWLPMVGPWNNLWKCLPAERQPSSSGPPTMNCENGLIFIHTAYSIGWHCVVVTSMQHRIRQQWIDQEFRGICLPSASHMPETIGRRTRKLKANTLSSARQTGSLFSLNSPRQTWLIADRISNTQHTPAHRHNNRRTQTEWHRPWIWQLIYQKERKNLIWKSKSTNRFICKTLTSLLPSMMAMTCIAAPLFDWQRWMMSSMWSHQL